MARIPMKCPGGGGTRPGAWSTHSEDRHVRNYHLRSIRAEVTVNAHTLGLLAVIGFLAWVAIDYARNHLSKCQVCKGTGILKSTFFSHKYRPCPRCRR